MIDLNSPLQRAIEVIDIPKAWDRLGLDGTPRRSCRVPWREDKNASLSIFDDGRMFKDFATGDSGNVVKFVSLATNRNLSDAAKILIEWNGGSSPDYARPVRKPKPPPKTQSAKKPLPAIDKGTIRELTDLRRLRGIPVFTAFELLGKRGIFGFCNHARTRCWVMTDNAHRNAQARPLYADKAQWGPKAKTLPGCDAGWPIGASTITDCETVLLTEGPPDMLAVATAIWSELDGVGFDRIGFVCMTGGNASIADDALPLFKGKHVKIFAHYDETKAGRCAGKEAFNRWWKQLKPHALSLTGWISEREGEDFNDWASRHWLESEDGLSLPEPILPTNERPAGGTASLSVKSNSNNNYNDGYSI